MSRRKQDNPQQLRRSVDDEDEAHGILEGDEAPPHDLIKCGECNKDFALADIVKFIEHKRKCYPRTDHIQQVAPSEEGEDGEDAAIGKTDTSDVRESTETVEDDKEEVTIMDVVVRSEKPKIITPIKRISSTSSMQRDLISPRVKQTQTQTSDPEQSKTYICYSCKDLFENAASLLEHVQCDHGMQIYQQPWKISDSNSTLSECSSHCSTEAKASRKTHTPESPNNDLKVILPASSSSSSSSAIPLPPPLPPPVPAVSMPVSSSVAAPPSIHHPPMLVHSPHAHLPVHSLDGNPLSMFMRPPTNERHMYHSGPVNPGSCVTLREVLAPEHSNMERVGLNSHIMMSQGYDHNSHHTFSPTNPAIVEAANIDLYSQRLRELAAAGPMMHPKKKGFHYPVFAPRFKSPFSPKVKACEFCGKTFKFQSNLIVHRRSHTGEKPYKCQLCDHACSQASKLKRHMKTHINKPPSTLTSPSSDQQSLGDEAGGGETSASSLIKTAVDRYMSESKYSSKDTSVDDEEEEEEEEGEEEFEDEEEMEEVSDDDENAGENSSDAEGPSQNAGEDHHGEKENHSSLLSEVMKHTGLSEIQQYSEAYRQAIAERYVNRRHSSRIEEHAARQTSDRHPNELGSGEETLKNVLAGTSYQDHEKESAYLRQSPSLSPRNAMMGLEQVTKRIKIEPSSPTWASESSSLPSKDPFIHSPGQPSESSPSTSATNGTLSSYYSRSNATNSSDRTSHSSPTGTLPYSSLGMHKSPKQIAMDRRSGTCEFCGKVFKNCSNLTVHRRSHTGEKPYKCKLCPYACAQSSKLTRHMKTHGHGAKEVFKCEVCGMPFSVYSTLEKHMKKNHWGNIRGTTR